MSQWAHERDLITWSPRLWNWRSCQKSLAPEIGHEERGSLQGVIIHRKQVLPWFWDNLHRAGDQSIPFTQVELDFRDATCVSLHGRMVSRFSRRDNTLGIEAHFTPKISVPSLSLGISIKLLIF